MTATLPPTTTTSLANAEHYVWGDGCDGWHLLKHPDLSVIQERVPADRGGGTAVDIDAMTRD